MPAGPKVARRDLKEDKVYLTLAGVADFLARNRFLVALIALGVLLMFALGYYLNTRARQKAVEASSALHRAVTLELPSEKITALKDVSAEYSGSSAGRRAQFEVGNALYDLGRYDEAQAAFQKFVKENPDHQLAAAAMEAIGYCLESQGKWQEAADAYEALMKRKPTSPVAARVNYRIGLCYENIGEKDKAIEAYARTTTLLPQTLWAEYAEQRLGSLSPPAIPSSEDMPSAPE
ncbi:MAG: DUF3808 domain-containing protein [Candidatus Abyssobacteria bacterium SURF_17]|jgi:tetratricopeptide (TPR) repeat protein|uniref:DUF3808 domain-containing protein n=1 Tax=Candidatus Abyssobacteria bacterium SURF_17 TaxID=2093361 RepID=A0A419ENS6_9BACT|nr:MAG: DUF3808 domain-containing protein [Candidatus Abyssubacteria bacterium SURF_17]